MIMLMMMMMMMLVMMMMLDYINMVHALTATTCPRSFGVI